MSKPIWPLVGGVVAGPLFLGTWLVQALTRPGYDPTYHPLSLLSLGALGWIQIANFVVTGALYVAGAVGMRRSLPAGTGATWGPLLIGGMGVGLICSGVFVTDAGAGFPPGAPAGPPAHITWHGILHEIGFLVATLAWIAACVVFARRFARGGRRGWLVACVAAPVTVFVLDGWPDLHSLSLRLVAGQAVASGLVASLAVHLIREQGAARDRAQVAA